MRKVTAPPTRESGRRLRVELRVVLDLARDWLDFLVRVRGGRLSDRKGQSCQRISWCQRVMARRWGVVRRLVAVESAVARRPAAVGPPRFVLIASSSNTSRRRPGAARREPGSMSSRSESLWSSSRGGLGRLDRGDGVSPPKMSCLSSRRVDDAKMCPRQRLAKPIFILRVGLGREPVAQARYKLLTAVRKKPPPPLSR